MKNKKGFSSEVLAIILLIVALASIIVLWLVWSQRGEQLAQSLSDMFLL